MNGITFEKLFSDVNTRLLLKTEQNLLDEIDKAIDHIMEQHKYRNKKDRNTHRINNRRLLEKSMFTKATEAHHVKNMIFDTIWNPSFKTEKEVRLTEVFYHVYRR